MRNTKNRFDTLFFLLGSSNKTMEYAFLFIYCHLVFSSLFFYHWIARAHTHWHIFTPNDNKKKIRICIWKFGIVKFGNVVFRSYFWNLRIPLSIHVCNTFKYVNEISRTVGPHQQQHREKKAVTLILTNLFVFLFSLNKTNINHKWVNYLRWSDNLNLVKFPLRP